MTKIINLLLLLVIAASLGAQEIIYERYQEGTDFWLLVPYNTIVFKKDKDRANYQVSMEIRNQRKKLVGSFGHTLDLPRRDWLSDTAIPVRFDAKLEPGKYEVKLKLRNTVLGDKKELKRSFNLGDYTPIGQAWLIAKKEGIDFIPGSMDMPQELESCQIRQKFSIAADSVAIRTEKFQQVYHQPASPLVTSLMRDAGLPASVNITFYEGNIHYRMNPFVYSPWFSYNVYYSLKDQLQQLRYLTNQNQWQRLSRLADKDLPEGIESFWRDRDPSPGTARNEAREEFYRRVVKADEMHTIHKKLKGWSSDRGRIYIKFGEPDEILEEVHPIDGSYPTIVWIYYQEKREFIFDDLGGYGQYTLRNKDEEYSED